MGQVGRGLYRLKRMGDQWQGGKKGKKKLDKSLREAKEDLTELIVVKPGEDG